MEKTGLEERTHALGQDMRLHFGFILLVSSFDFKHVYKYIFIYVRNTYITFI